MKRMIKLACIAFLIIEIVGCSSTDMNAKADSSDMNDYKNNATDTSPTKSLPSDQKELSITVQPKEINPMYELKPTKQKVRLDPETEKEAQEKKKPLKGLFKTSLEAVQSQGKLDLNFTLMNISGKDLQISYGSGQRYDIWVYNEKNEQVYKWSINKAFTQALIMTEIKESGRLSFAEIWNLKDTKGNSVPAGQYTIVVKVMIGLRSGAISQDELTAKASIEIK